MSTGDSMGDWGGRGGYPGGGGSIFTDSRDSNTTFIYRKESQGEDTWWGTDIHPWAVSPRLHPPLCHYPSLGSVSSPLRTCLLIFKMGALGL